MTKIKRIVPFGWVPGHWGLTGKLRERAEAEYTLIGEELDKKNIEINLGDRTDEEVAVALLEHEVKYGRLTQKELDKQSATINNEPWVDIKNLETDPDNPRYGAVELDWNEAFIDHLEKHGYGPNPDDEDTINAWFNDLCRNIALDAYDGVGDFQERVEDTDETVLRRKMHEDAIPMNVAPLIDGAPSMEDIKDDDL
jgi:hypothetical protein